ncbi:MAG: DUF1801 domain-containing protein [Planctomycetota bacterium]
MSAELGTFEELLEASSPEIQTIAHALRAMVLALHPESTEVVRLGERAATFGHGPKKMSEGYVYIQPHKKWVNLGFFMGAALADGEGLLEGAGKKLRHVKVHTEDAVGTPALRALVQAAIDERAAALGI